MSGNKLPTMEEMTSFYLYEKSTPPVNKGSADLIRPLTKPSGEEYVSQYPPINVQDFMDGPGRFAAASDFEYVKKFFNENYQKPAYRLQPGEYSKAEVMQHFGLEKGWTSLTLAMYDDGKDDLIERAYIWNTSAFMLDDRARFVVEPDGDRYIKNFAIRPYKKENFDFVGGNTSEIVNGWLRSQIDPAGIGRKVEISFTGDAKTRTLTQEDYRIEQNKSSHWSLINGAKVGAGSFGIGDDIIERLEKSGVLYDDKAEEELEKLKQSKSEKHSFNYETPDWNSLTGNDLYRAVLSADSSQLDMLGKSFAQSAEGQKMTQLGDRLWEDLKEQQELERQQELAQSSRAMVRTL